MIALLFSPIGRMVGGIAVVAVLLGGVYWYGYTSGRDAVLSRLAADRITLLKDGKEIDNEVLTADDDALCALLGGCVSDSAGE